MLFFCDREVNETNMSSAHRRQKALDEVKKLHRLNDEEEEDRAKVQEKLAAQQVWEDLGEDFQEHVVEPLKKWSGRWIYARLFCKVILALLFLCKYSGFSHLQECSRPTSHIDSDDEDFEDNEQDIPKKKKSTKTESK